MKNLNTDKVILIKKVIGLGSAIVCLLLMFFNVFSYTSSTSVAHGDSVTWSDGVSLYNFLFNGDKIVLYDTIEYLREIFLFSYVVIWGSFIFTVISLGVLIYGVFSKNSLFSKIGSVVLLVSLIILTLVNFDVHLVNNTTKYLSIFTPFYIVSLFVSLVNLYLMMTIVKNKNSKN